MKAIHHQPRKLSGVGLTFSSAGFDGNVQNNATDTDNTTHDIDGQELLASESINREDADLLDAHITQKRHGKRRGEILVRAYSLNESSAISRMTTAERLETAACEHSAHI